MVVKPLGKASFFLLRQTQLPFLHSLEFMQRLLAGSLCTLQKTLWFCLCRASHPLKHGYRAIGYKNHSAQASRKTRNKGALLSTSMEAKLWWGGEGWYKCLLVPSAQVTWSSYNSVEEGGRAEGKGHRMNRRKRSRQVICLCSALSELTLILGINAQLILAGHLPNAMLTP